MSDPYYVPQDPHSNSIRTRKGDKIITYELKYRGIDIHWYGLEPDEAAHYCMIALISWFALNFAIFALLPYSPLLSEPILDLYTQASKHPWFYFGAVAYIVLPIIVALSYSIIRCSVCSAVFIIDLLIPDKKVILSIESVADFEARMQAEEERKRLALLEKENLKQEKKRRAQEAEENRKKAEKLERERREQKEREKALARLQRTEQLRPIRMGIANGEHWKRVRGHDHFYSVDHLYPVKFFGLASITITNYSSPPPEQRYNAHRLAYETVGLQTGPFRGVYLHGIPVPETIAKPLVVGPSVLRGSANQDVVIFMLDENLNVIMLANPGRWELYYDDVLDNVRAGSTRSTDPDERDRFTAVYNLVKRLNGYYRRVVLSDTGGKGPGNGWA